jgi:alpha-amylase/alpha-mannosidase (GH57 family)
MKIITASNGKKTVRMSKKEWESLGKKAGWANDTMHTQYEGEYKGHKIRIALDEEPNEVTKAWHYVYTPEGQEIIADISPYDTDPRTVQMWIDAGYPKRQGIGPLSKEDLLSMIAR